MLSISGLSPLRNGTNSLKLTRTMGPTLYRTFQSTSKRSLTIPFLPVLPQKPGGVVGTPNDAFKHPKPNKMEGSIHWWLEKVFAVTSVPLVTTAMVTSGPLSTVSDSIFSVAFLGYCYMEFHSCIADYIPKRIYGRWHSYALYLLGGGSLISLFGIYKLEKESDGTVGFVKKVWLSTTSPLKQTEPTLTTIENDGAVTK